VRRVHYAWIVAGVGFLTLVMSSGFRSTTGVLLLPLHEEYAWSHETISAAIFVNLVCFGLGAPFAAATVERFGVRHVTAIALTIIAASSLLTISMTSPWQLFLLWGVVNGLATGAISVPLAAIIANRWFVVRRGLVTGLMTASYASGQLVFLPLLAWLAETNWRLAAVTVAAAAALVVLPIVLLLMRDYPEDAGVAPYGAVNWRPPERSAPGFGAAIDGLLVGIRSPTFWILAGSFFVCGATTNGLISTHLIPAAHDHGIAEVTAASLLALIGLFDVVGTIGSGWLTDRYDPRKLLVAYYGLRGLSLLLLPLAFGSSHPALLAFAVVYGLDWVATVPPTIALTATTFGADRVGVVFGWIFAAHQLGAATAAWAAGAIRTDTGDYTPAFVAAGALAVVASGLVLLIARPRAPQVAT
jgi:sugar phosphate permease